MYRVRFSSVCSFTAFGLAVVLLAGAGCNNPNNVVVANNTPPLIALVAPELDADGSPVTFIEDEGLQVIVQVEDAEDPFEELEITWTVLSAASPDEGVLLAQTEVDTTGRSELMVLGLTAGTWYLRVEVEDTGVGIAAVDIPKVLEPNFPRRLRHRVSTCLLMLFYVFCGNA